MTKPSALLLALLVTSGCTSTNLNNALGTPKNPLSPFADPTWADAARAADTAVLTRLYAELLKPAATPEAYDVPEQQMRPYLSAGFAMSDFYCQKFFTKTDEAYRRRSFGRSVTNDVGTVLQSVLNLANAGKDAVTGVGIATGLADSTWRHYDTAFLISADLGNVQGLVHAAQDNFRARTLGQNGTLPADYSTAQSVILRYANLCSFLGMQSLLNVSATEKKQQLNNDTENKTGEQNGGAGGTNGGANGGAQGGGTNGQQNGGQDAPPAPPEGSAQPALAPNKPAGGD